MEKQGYFYKYFIKSRLFSFPSLQVHGICWKNVLLQHVLHFGLDDIPNRYALYIPGTILTVLTLLALNHYDCIVSGLDIGVFYCLLYFLSMSETAKKNGASSSAVINFMIM